MLVLKINFSAIASVAHLKELPINQAIGDAYSNSGKKVLRKTIKDFGFLTHYFGPKHFDKKGTFSRPSGADNNTLRRLRCNTGSRKKMVYVLPPELHEHAFYSQYLFSLISYYFLNVCCPRSSVYRM